MHVGIHTFRILAESLELIQHRFLEIHFFHPGREGGYYPSYLHNGVYKSPTTKNNVSLQKATITLE